MTEIVDLAAERQRRRDALTERLLDGVLSPDWRGRPLTGRQAQLVAILRDALSRATPRKPRGGAA
jgi:hypothetical protein